MKIDNPKSIRHHVYQSAVNRCTWFVVQIFLALLCAEVLGDSLGAFVPLIFILGVVFFACIAIVVVSMVFSSCRYFLTYLFGG